MSNKMHVCCTSLTMSPKNAPHFYLQYRFFCITLTKDTMFPSLITSSLNNTLPNRSIITKLLPTQPRNVMLGINNDMTSAQNINMERNSITNQVVEVLGSFTNNLSNEKCRNKQSSRSPTLKTCHKP